MGWPARSVKGIRFPVSARGPAKAAGGLRLAGSRWRGFGMRGSFRAGQELVQLCTKGVAERGEVPDVQVGEQPDADLPVVAEQRHANALLGGERDLRIASAQLAPEKVERELRPGNVGDHQ